MLYYLFLMLFYAFQFRVLEKYIVETHSKMTEAMIFTSSRKLHIGYILIY